MLSMLPKSFVAVHSHRDRHVFLILRVSDTHCFVSDPLAAQKNCAKAHSHFIRIETQKSLTFLLQTPPRTKKKTSPL